VAEMHIFVVRTGKSIMCTQVSQLIDDELVD